MYAAICPRVNKSCSMFFKILFFLPVTFHIMSGEQMCLIWSSFVICKYFLTYAEFHWEYRKDIIWQYYQNEPGNHDVIAHLFRWEGTPFVSELFKAVWVCRLGLSRYPSRRRRIVTPFFICIIVPHDTIAQSESSTASGLGNVLGSRHLIF